MIHLDMFSGIGLFSYAADHVWNLEHIFCEIEDWPHRFLKQEYQNARIERDIKNFDGAEHAGRTFLLTAGVPCQPASVAGKRKGTEDDRWLWPEALRVMAEAQPEWCIFENPLGILTLEKGLVLENLLLEMESQGYAVQPYIIPAGGVSAVHRRYRVWIVAKSESVGWRNGIAENIWKAKRKEHTFSNSDGRASSQNASNSIDSRLNGQGISIRGKRQEEISLSPWSNKNSTSTSDSEKIRLQRSIKTNGSEGQKPRNKFVNGCNREWKKPWPEVAIESCIRGVDVSFADGVYEVEKFEKGERTKRMKALGNTIQWEVAMAIMQAIREEIF